MRRAGRTPRARHGKRVLAIGMRKSGAADFHIRVMGDAASRFPPLLLKMSLHEMQDWLHEMQSAPERAARQGRPRLRVVG